MKRLQSFVALFVTMLVFAGLWTPAMADNTDDFKWDKENTSYTSQKTAAGWSLVNCAIRGVDNTYAPTLNGKTTAVGSITSPILKGGVGTISFKYANTYSETKGVSLKIEVKQGGAVAKTLTLTNTSVTQNKVYTYTSEDINLEGDFQLVITNNSPSNSTSNKDRVSVWNIVCTEYAGGPVKETTKLQWDSQLVTMEEGETGWSPYLEVSPDPAFDLVKVTSKDNSIVEVESPELSDNGKVKLIAKSAGTTEIVATIGETDDYKGSTATFTVKVVDPNAIPDTEITPTFFGYTSNAYANKSKKDEATGMTFAAVYTGAPTTMGFNTNNSNGKASEIVVTKNENGYVIKSIDIEFSSAGNGVNVYAQDAMFTATTIGNTPAKPTTAKKVNSEAIKSKQTIEIGAQAFAIWPAGSGVITISKVTVHYAPAAAVDPGKETVATPGFSVVSGSAVVAGTEVKITTATEGASIYYTLDGSTPTAESTLYTTPLTISEACTIKAIAVKDGFNDSSVATATYTIKVVCSSFAQLLKLASDTEIEMQGKMTVVYQKGSYLYVISEDGAPMLLYGNSKQTYANGDVFTSLSGTYKLYNNEPEITPYTIGNVTTGGEPVAPAVKNVEDVTSDMVNAYMTLANVTVANGKNIVSADGGASIQLYDRFGLNHTYNEGARYDITGVVGIFNSNVQFYPIEVTQLEEVEHPETPVATIDGVPFDGYDEVDYGTEIKLTSLHARYIVIGDEQFEAPYTLTATEDEIYTIYGVNDDGEQSEPLELMVEIAKPHDFVVTLGGETVENDGSYTVPVGTVMSMSALSVNRFEGFVGDNELEYTGNTAEYTLTEPGTYDVMIFASNPAVEGSVDIYFTVEVEEVDDPEYGDVTFDFTEKDYGMTRLSGNTQVYNPDLEIHSGIVTVKLSGNTRLWSDGLRFYKESSFSVSVPDGYTIESVIFGNNEAKFNKETDSFTYKCNITEKNIPISSLTVKYEITEDVTTGIHIKGKDATAEGTKFTCVNGETEIVLIAPKGHKIHYRFVNDGGALKAPRKAAAEDYGEYGEWVHPDANPYVIKYENGYAGQTLHMYSTKDDVSTPIVKMSISGSGVTTSIEEIEVVAGDSAAAVGYFDLQGRRVANPTKGIYVTSDGRKMIIR